MKKYFFMAFAVAGMLSSCTSDDVVSNGISQENSSLVPIRIGLGTGVSVETRGTGTVGDTTEINNVWYGQKINVYMLEKGTLNPAKWVDANGVETSIYENSVMIAPYVTDNGVAGNDSVIAELEDKGVKYYPDTKAFDFWGYRLDGAEGNNQPVAGTDSLTIDFEIDGSQDVMVAKAAPSPEDVIKMTDEAGTDLSVRAFSSWAARRGVQPVLNFKHLLTRLTFEIVAGDSLAAGKGENLSAIRVTNIRVYSKKTGSLIIAYTPDATVENQIAWTPGQEYAPLELKERLDGDTPDKQLVALATNGVIQPTWNSLTHESDTLKVGEALLVSPEDEYAFEIVLEQDALTSKNADAQMETISRVVPATITRENSSFLAGHSYRVQVKLYGLQEISISTALTAWTDDPETIFINPEDESWQ